MASEKKFQEACHGDSINLAYLTSNKKNNRVGKGRAHTIDTKNLQSVVDHGCVRRLTPLECERLQGFPDNWTTKGISDKIISDISDTQRYKLLGNAVSVIMVKTIANKLRKNSSAKTLSGITGVIQKLPLAKEDFVNVMQQDLIAQKHHTKISVEKLARTLAIIDKTEVKELTELAIVNSARHIALDDSLFVDEKYHRIVDLYNSQVTLSHRTSQSILLQQYSTPAPIGFMMGIFCGIDQLHKKGGFALEPSAGNGLLTIAARPERIDVNEVDEIRRRNLATQGYNHVWDRDASKPFSDLRHKYKAVVTNPPFGMLDTKMVFDGYPIQPLEHVMAIQALDCMDDDGKAAFIIGGHTHWDDKGRVQAGKNRLFFNYLYHHYHVADVILIDGKKLYSRQGTSFDTRLVLINGRKETPEGAAPVHDKEYDLVVRNFDDLFNRIMEAMDLKRKVWAKIQLSTTAIRYEQEYLPLLKKYEDTLVLHHYNYSYEVIGKKWAFFITKHFEFNLSAEFLYKGESIPLVRIPENNLLMVVEKLNKMSTPFVIIETQQSSHTKDISTLEAKAKLLLSSLRAKGLGSQRPGSEDSSKLDLMRRCAIYMKAQQHCNGAALLYRHGAFYEVFGRDVGFLHHYLKLPIYTSIAVEDETIDMARISEDSIPQVLFLLNRMSYRYVINDDPIHSRPLNRTGNAISDKKPIWEIPLPVLLKSEEQEYERMMDARNNERNYDLPYSPEFVGLFNNIMNRDAYKPSNRNPFSPNGALELHTALFRKLCLKTIHQYSVLLGMSADIVLREDVLADYPELKLKQDAKITYLKTLVEAGPQLNGTD